MAGFGSQIPDVTARGAPRDHTPIFSDEETESQSLSLWQNWPVASADLSQPSGSGSPTSLSASVGALCCQLALLEARGNGAWDPSLDYGALSWEPGLLPQQDSHHAPSSPCQFYSVILALCSSVDPELSPR